MVDTKRAKPIFKRRLEFSKNKEKKKLFLYWNMLMRELLLDLLNAVILLAPLRSLIISLLFVSALFNFRVCFECYVKIWKYLRMFFFLYWCCWCCCCCCILYPHFGFSEFNKFVRTHRLLTFVPILYNNNYYFLNGQTKNEFWCWYDGKSLFLFTLDVDFLPPLYSSLRK